MGSNPQLQGGPHAQLNGTSASAIHALPASLPSQSSSSALTQRLAATQDPDQRRTMLGEFCVNTCQQVPVICQYIGHPLRVRAPVLQSTPGQNVLHILEFTQDDMKSDAVNSLLMHYCFITCSLCKITNHARLLLWQQFSDHDAAVLRQNMSIHQSASVLGSALLPECPHKLPNAMSNNKMKTQSSYITKSCVILYHHIMLVSSIPGLLLCCLGAT